MEVKRSNIKTYKLKQITPMIHFQYDEDGACLRPSEVKPKLDIFIKLFCQKFNIMMPDEWYMDFENKDKKPSLRYKMRIEGQREAEINENIHKLYFGDIGKEKNEKKKSLFYYNGMILKIICFCKEKVKISDETIKNKIKKCEIKLFDLIDFVLPAFFYLNCFGMRSSKGFGSFVLQNNLEANTAYFEEYLPMFADYYYYCEYDKKQNFNSTFDDIYVICGMMKSGFNFTWKNKDGYYKGRIFKYFTDKNIISDKAFIKQNILSKKSDENQKSKKNKYYFSRAMLGLAQNYEFKNTNNNVRAGKVKIDNENIKRFRHPVQMKPEDKCLLMIPREIPDVMYKAEFKFVSGKTERSIKTPSKEDFNLECFLDYFIEEFNKGNEIDKSPKIVQTIQKKLKFKKIKAGEK